jgi:CO/xanthine dehydrogenase Mo-binding subunit
VNELGIKGLGELGNVGTNAAVANALFRPTGMRVRDLPSGSRICSALPRYEARNPQKTLVI